jgi:hypothetical protein
MWSGLPARNAGILAGAWRFFISSSVKTNW